MGWRQAAGFDVAARNLGATEGYADLPGLRLHYVRQGEGPPVVLLHGFPENWYSWRNQLPALAAAGYTAIAPDLRGYGQTGTPAAGYDIRTLAGDIVHLIAALGYEQAAVVGHDWGGAVAWAVAMLHPQRVSRLAVLDAAHPAAFVRELWHGDQARRSRYMLLFQLPWFPEWLLARNAGLPLLRAVRRSAINPSAFSPYDLVRMLQLWADGHSIHGGLNYYRGIRSLLADRTARASLGMIHTPTLVLWGAHDRFGSVALTEGLEQWVTDVRVRVLPDAGHWVHQERADEINRLLIEFLRDSA